MKLWVSREEVMFLCVSRNRTNWMQEFEVPEEVAEEYFLAEERFNKAEERLLEQIPEEHRDSLNRKGHPMTLTLIDDGTLDTVFSCSDCGQQLRYSAEWRESYSEEDREAMFIDAESDHEEECEAHQEEEMVLCQARLKREDYELAHSFQDSGGHPVRPREITRHPNNDEDEHFLRWLQGCAEQERQPDLVEWFMRVVKGEQTLADLRQTYEEGELEDTE